MTMMAFLDELPEDQQRVLVELYFRGKSVTETAATLGIPARTVKSRSLYALRALRQRQPALTPTDTA